MPDAVLDAWRAVTGTADDVLTTLRDFLDHGFWTHYPTPVVMLFFVAICIVGVAFFIPKTLFAPAAGALFGAFLGTIVAMVGATLGSLLALAVGRRLGRARVRRWLHRKQALADLDARLTRHGVVPVILLRLVPIMPGFVVNYGSAATGIRTKHFAVGTVIGLLPATMVQVAAGASVRNGLSMPVVLTAAVGMLAVAGAGLWFRGRGKAAVAEEPADNTDAAADDAPAKDAPASAA
ncbi:hypothetical protein GCM10023205_43050 [Yinghuangia aomiensis]|uniref:TVP38/TMEM64 family membrane protein n=1 Tax=Yinghuangia aomiensis TaxID=676205 RepID=A0ABP9HJP8_9ACTN